MTTATYTTPATNVLTATDNYNWIQAVHNVLAALGLVQVSSGTVSGQVNLGTGSVTVAAPGSPAISTPYQQGFEVYALTAAGLPTIYMKVYYWLSYFSAGAGYLPGIAVSFCNAISSTGTEQGATTNPGGAGTSGGPAAILTQAPINAGVTSFPTRTWYLATDGANYFSLADDPEGRMAALNSVNNGYGMMSRLQNPNTGAFVGDGLFMDGRQPSPVQTGAGTQLVASGQSNAVVLNFSANTRTFLGTASGGFAAQNHGFIYPSNISATSQAAPVVCVANPNLGLTTYGPPMSVAYGFAPDFIAAELVNITEFGTSRQYIYTAKDAALVIYQ